MGPIGMRMDNGKDSTMRNFIVCNVHPNIVRVIKSRRLGWGVIEIVDNSFDGP